MASIVGGRKRGRDAFVEENPYGYDPDLPVLRGDPRLNPGMGLGIGWHPSQPVRNTWRDWGNASHKLFSFQQRRMLPLDAALPVVSDATAARLVGLSLDQQRARRPQLRDDPPQDAGESSYAKDDAGGGDTRFRGLVGPADTFSGPQHAGGASASAGPTMPLAPPPQYHTRPPSASHAAPAGVAASSSSSSLAGMAARLHMMGPTLPLVLPQASTSATPAVPAHGTSASAVGIAASHHSLAGSIGSAHPLQADASYRLPDFGSLGVGHAFGGTPASVRRLGIVVPAASSSHKRRAGTPQDSEGGDDSPVGTVPSSSGSAPFALQQPTLGPAWQQQQQHPQPQQARHRPQSRVSPLSVPSNNLTQPTLEQIMASVAAPTAQPDRPLTIAEMAAALSSGATSIAGLSRDELLHPLQPWNTALVAALADAVQRKRQEAVGREEAARRARRAEQRRAAAPPKAAAPAQQGSSGPGRPLGSEMDADSPGAASGSPTEQAAASAGLLSSTSRSSSAMLVDSGDPAPAPAPARGRRQDRWAQQGDGGDSGALEDGHNVCPRHGRPLSRPRGSGSDASPTVCSACVASAGSRAASRSRGGAAGRNAGGSGAAATSSSGFDSGQFNPEAVQPVGGSDGHSDGASMSEDVAWSECESLLAPSAMGNVTELLGLGTGTSGPSGPAMASSSGR